MQHDLVLRLFYFFSNWKWHQENEKICIVESLTCWWKHVRIVGLACCLSPGELPCPQPPVGNDDCNYSQVNFQVTKFHNDSTIRDTDISDREMEGLDEPQLESWGEGQRTWLWGSPQEDMGLSSATAGSWGGWGVCRDWVLVRKEWAGKVHPQCWGGHSWCSARPLHRPHRSCSGH